MKEIELTQGMKCKVDDEDFDGLSKHRWCYTNGYAARRKSQAEGACHEFIHTRLMADVAVEGLAEGESTVVIHRDGDRLNCQKDNLLKTSKRHRQQRMAPRGASGLKGVQMRKGKWTAHIGVAGKTLHLGNFSEKDDAARAYNEAARKHYGAAAKLNDGLGFPAVAAPTTQEVEHCG